jgi:hypothetical protein
LLRRAKWKWENRRAKKNRTEANMAKIEKVSMKAASKGSIRAAKSVL